MVEVSNKHKSITVEVSSKNGNTVVAASSDTAQYWSNQSRAFAKESKDWANKLGSTVDGTEYSAKHYAELANSYIEGFDDVVTSNTNNIITTSNDCINQIAENTEAAIDSINTTKTTILNDIEFVADGEKKEIGELIDSGKDELKETIGDVKVLTTLEIGDIGIAPLGIDETKGKRRYLNGQVIIQDQYKQFTKKVKSAIVLYPSLACTESEWQTTETMTVGGQVGKFVVDDNAGTIRLPKIIMPIQGLTDLSKLGEIVSAGLPQHTHTRGTMNITGQIDNVFNGGANGSGAIYASGSTYNGPNASYNADNPLFIFDASRSWTGSTSNANYTNSLTTTNTVQQEQIQYPYFIQVATGAETEDNIINEIELNNPYSLFDVKWSDKLLNNISWLRSAGQFNSSIDYASAYNFLLTEYNSGTDTAETVAGVTITFRRGGSTGIKITTDKNAYDLILANTGTAWYFVLDVANTGFYLPQTNAFLQFGGTGDFVEAGLPDHSHNIFAGATTNTDVTATTPYIAQMGEYGAGDYKYQLSGTDVYPRGALTGLASTMYPIYGKSNTVQPNAVKGYLYFYVGETVQNANLINAGRIEEKIAGLIPDNSSLISSYGLPGTYGIGFVGGASGATYTAPANGYFEFGGKASSSSVAYLNAHIVETHLQVQSWIPPNFQGNTVRGFLPCKKGQTLSLSYYQLTLDVLFFRYAEGDE